MKRGLAQLGVVILTAVFCLSVAPQAWAANVHGVLRVVKGDVKIKSGKSGKVERAKIGQKVYPQDTVLTGKDSRAKVVMVDKNEINISPGSEVVLQNYEYDPAKKKKNVLLNVIYGKVRSKVEQKYDGKTSKFQVKTPSAVAGVRGTDFIASFNSQNSTSQVVTFEGQVEFGLPAPGGGIKNPVMVNPGQMTTASLNSPPAPPVPVPENILAEMDAESNAETPGGPSSDPREPAGQDSGDGEESNDQGQQQPEGEKPAGDEAKADGPGEAAGPSEDQARGDSPSGESSGGEGTSGGVAPAAGDTDGGGSASPSTGDTAGTPSPSGSDPARAPASSTTSGGGGMLPPPPPMDSTAGPVLAPLPPGGTIVQPLLPLDPTTTTPECDFCRTTIENSNTKLIITVTQ